MLLYPCSEIVFEPNAATAPEEMIPSTRLFGRSPQGMNATGEADLISKASALRELQAMGRDLGTFASLEPAPEQTPAPTKDPQQAQTPAPAARQTPAKTPQ